MVAHWGEQKVALLVDGWAGWWDSESADKLAGLKVDLWDQPLVEWLVDNWVRLKGKGKD